MSRNVLLAWLLVAPVAFLSVVSLAGCKSADEKERKERERDEAELLRFEHSTAVPLGPGAVAPRITIELETGARLKRKTGTLTCSIRITNGTDRSIQVFYDKCELEQQNGLRKRRNPPSRVAAAWNAAVKGEGDREAPLVGVGEMKQVTMEFGDKGVPCDGEAFRFYTYVQATDGTGLVENVPVLVIGPPTSGFSKDPENFQRGK